MYTNSQIIVDELIVQVSVYARVKWNMCTATEAILVQECYKVETVPYLLYALASKVTTPPFDVCKQNVFIAVLVHNQIC